MERRRARRHKRRLQVRFWKPPEPDPSDGFTTNISSGGMFVATGSPAPPGHRVRVECLAPHPDYVFHAVVVHATRVAPAFRSIRDSGMGIRFLSPAEMVAELIENHAAPRPAAAAGASRRAIRPGLCESARPRQPVSAAAPRRMGSEPPPVGAAPSAPEDNGSGDEPQVYLVRFASPNVFLDVFRTQYREGEFFVPTHRPAELGSEVVVELELLDGGQAPLSLPGKVVSYVPEDAGDGVPAKGMNVLFSSGGPAIEELRQVIRRVRGEGLA